MVVVHEGHASHPPDSCTYTDIRPIRQFLIWPERRHTESAYGTGLHLEGSYLLVMVRCTAKLTPRDREILVLLS